MQRHDDSADEDAPKKYNKKEIREIDKSNLAFIQTFERPTETMPRRVATASPTNQSLSQARRPRARENMTDTPAQCKFFS